MDISICFTPEFAESAQHFFLSVLGVTLTLATLKAVASWDEPDYMPEFDDR